MYGVAIVLWLFSTGGARALPKEEVEEDADSVIRRYRLPSYSYKRCRVLG